MEEMKITQVFFDNDPDVSIIDLVLNEDKPMPAVSVPVNDDTDEKYDVYLRVAPGTGKIVGAMIMYSDNLFRELAQAFANKDLNHPDVRFFLEKKLEAYARAHADKLELRDTREPSPAPAE